MKKLKLLLLVTFSAIIAVSVAFAVGCKKEDPHKHATTGDWQTSATEHWLVCDEDHEEYERGAHQFNDDGVCTICGYDSSEGNEPDQPVTPGEKVYQSLTLNTNTVKKEYYVGESFSSTNLSAKANYSDESTSNVAERNLNINSSAFDNTQVGTYEIVVSYTTGGITHESSYTVTVSSAELSVNVTELECFIGDQLDYSELVVELTVTSPDKEPVTTNVTSSALYGWSSVNVSKEGAYNVEVSYNLNTTTALKQTIVVNVLPVKEGLDITLTENIVSGATIDDYGFATVTLTSGQKATINTDEIVVRKSDKYGNVIDEPLSADDYTVELYVNDQKVESHENLAGGGYQIWVSAESSYREGFTLKAHTLIYIVDNLVSLTWNNEADGTKTEQYSGADTISKTWTFTATYTSGVTKVIPFSSLSSSAPDTVTVGNNLKYTASYTATNAVGTPITKTADVTYTIKKLEGEINYEVAYTFDFASTSIVTTWGEVQGATSHVTLASNNATTYRQETTPKTHEDGASYTDALEVKAGKSLELTIGALPGNVTIKVYATHSSADVERTVYIDKDSTRVAEEKITGATDSPLYLLQVDNATAGKYVICATDTMRVYAVIVTYSIDYDNIKETKTDTYTYSYSAIPTAGKTASCELTQADFTGVNSFLTVIPNVYNGTTLVSGTVYRNKTNLGESAGDVIEIKGDALTVTFKGTGTIALTVKSTGSSNTSSIALKDADGSYIAAQYSGTAAGTTDIANVYQVTGTTDVVFTFTVNVAGTYTICSLTSLYDRNTRVTGIVMTDTYEI